MVSLEQDLRKGERLSEQIVVFILTDLLYCRYACSVCGFHWNLLSSHWPNMFLANELTANSTGIHKRSKLRPIGLVMLTLGLWASNTTDSVENLLYNMFNAVVDLFTKF